MQQRLLALLAVIGLFGMPAVPASAGVSANQVEIGYRAIPSWNGRTVDVEVTISCGSYRSEHISVEVA